MSEDAKLLLTFVVILVFAGVLLAFGASPGGGCTGQYCYGEG